MAMLTKRQVLMLGGGAAAAALVGVRRATARPAIGETAPGFVGTDSHGQSHRLEDYRGKTVILEWTNHDCPYVRKHYGHGNMQALQKAAATAGHVWLSVISSAPGLQGNVTPTRANQLTVERDAAPSAVLLDPDGTIGLAYDARTTPHMYVIDPAGVLVYMGAIDDNPSARAVDFDNTVNYVTAALADLAAGRPVAVPLTRAYGCSVKYG